MSNAAWISTSEQLDPPEHVGQVLIYAPNRAQKVTAATLIKSGSTGYWWTGKHEVKLSEVTHWHFMLEPPES